MKKIFYYGFFFVQLLFSEEVPPEKKIKEVSTEESNLVKNGTFEEHGSFQWDFLYHPNDQKEEVTYGPLLGVFDDVNFGCESTTSLKMIDMDPTRVRKGHDGPAMWISPPFEVKKGKIYRIKFDIYLTDSLPATTIFFTLHFKSLLADGVHSKWTNYIKACAPMSKYESPSFALTPLEWKHVEADIKFDEDSSNTNLEFSVSRATINIDNVFLNEVDPSGPKKAEK